MRSRLYIGIAVNWLLTVCYLLTGVNVDLVDNKGRTALFTACLEGHETVAELLLKYGANVNLLVFSFVFVNHHTQTDKLYCST